MIVYFRPVFLLFLSLSPHFFHRLRTLILTVFFTSLINFSIYIPPRQNLYHIFDFSRLAITTTMDAKATLVLLFFTLLPYNKVFSQKTCSGFGYSRKIGRRLPCGIFKTLADDHIQCQKTCVGTENCFAINYCQKENGSKICELINRTEDAEEQKECILRNSKCEYNELEVSNPFFTYLSLNFWFYIRLCMKHWFLNWICKRIFVHFYQTIGDVFNLLFSTQYSPSFEIFLFFFLSSCLCTLHSTDTIDCLPLLLVTKNKQTISTCSWKPQGSFASYLYKLNYFS